MCIIFFQFCKRNSKKYVLILAANRDEYFSRPAKAAGFWKEAPNVLGGQDMTSDREGGSWLGITKQGKFGMLTNFRQPSDMNQTIRQSELRPRGEIVTNFLKGDQDANAFLDGLINGKFVYSKFNLLVGEYNNCAGFDISYGTNALKEEIGHCVLSQGVHGLCNSEINCSWTKVQKGKQMFTEIVSEENLGKEALVEKLFGLMHNDHVYYPDDGGSRQSLADDMAAPMSAIFVNLPQIQYGTRTTTIVLVDNEGHVTFLEKSMTDPTNIEDPKWKTNKFDFKIQN